MALRGLRDTEPLFFQRARRGGHKGRGVSTAAGIADLGRGGRVNTHYGRPNGGGLDRFWLHQPLQTSYLCGDVCKQECDKKEENVSSFVQPEH